MEKILEVQAADQTRNNIPLSQSLIQTVFNFMMVERKVEAAE